MHATRLAASAEVLPLSSAYVDVEQTLQVFSAALQVPAPEWSAAGKLDAYGSGIIAATVKAPPDDGTILMARPEAYRYLFIQPAMLSVEKHIGLIACVLNVPTRTVQEIAWGSHAIDCAHTYDLATVACHLHVPVPQSPQLFLYAHYGASGCPLEPIRLQRHPNHLPHHRRLQNLANYCLR